MEAALVMTDSSPDRHCLEQIVARSSEGILLLDARKAGLPIVFVNPAFESLTGYRTGELIGKRWHVLRRERGQHRGIDELQAAVERAEPIDVELPDQRKDGTVWNSHIGFSALRNARGEVCFFLVQQREASRRSAPGSAADVMAPPADAARSRPKLDAISRIDPSTGLPHYDHFAAILNRDIAVARRDRRPVSVMLFEIVELDAYRQTFGAKAADSCVRMIGAQLSSTLRRAGDLYARYDDTTLVAAVVGQETAEATLLAERIVDNVTGLRLHNPRAKSSRYVHVLSALCGGVPGSEDDADALLERVRRELAMRRTLAAARAAASGDGTTPTPEAAI
jgi:diguanylate cyclase (GGDEF)-like protein/PAS domain S-box-containing protein